LYITATITIMISWGTHTLQVANCLYW